MLVAIEKGCTFTVPGPEGGASLERVRAKPGELLELPDDVAETLIAGRLASPSAGIPPEAVLSTGHGHLPASGQAGPFAATPVEQPAELTEAEPVHVPANKFAPPKTAGGLRSFIRTPR